MNIPRNLCDIQPLFQPFAKRAQKNIERRRKTRKYAEYNSSPNKGSDSTEWVNERLKGGTLEKGGLFSPFFQMAGSNKCDLCIDVKEYACKRGRSTHDGVSCALLLMYGRKWAFLAEKTLAISPVRSARHKEGCSSFSSGFALKQMTACVGPQKDREN